MSQLETKNRIIIGGGFDPIGVLDSAGAAIIAVDRDGVIEYANTAARDLCRAGGRRFVGVRFAQIFGAASELTSAVERLLDGDVSTADLECRLDSQGAALGAAYVTVRVRPDGGGATITLSPKARRRSDARTVQTPPIARTLAHEVRNPLAGIRGAAQLIGKGAGPEVRTLVELICAEVDRIRRLTDQIDQVDPSHPPQRALINVHEVIDRVIQVLRPSVAGVAMVTDFDPSLPPIFADADQLIQAFLNLVKNASEAAPGDGDGVVRIATRFRTGARLRQELGGQARKLIEVSICDNGPGIAAHIMDRLFEPFTTTKAGGVGLGLAVAGRIVAAHGGGIEVDSAPGATVFRVLLPLEPQS